MKSRDIIAHKLLKDFKERAALDTLQQRYAEALLSGHAAATRRIVLDYAIRHAGAILLEYCARRGQWVLPTHCDAPSLADATLVHIDAALAPDGQGDVMHYFLTIPVTQTRPYDATPPQRWFGPESFAALHGFELDRKIPAIMQRIGLAAPVLRQPES